MTTVDSLRLAPFHLDDAGIAWVERWLLRLSPEQKLRQLFNLNGHGDDLQAVAALGEHGAGGVTRYGGSDLAASWQATRALLERSELPLLISGDIEGGAIGLPFGTALPNQLGLAATGSTALAEEAVARARARGALALGYNWSFTPVVDINAAFRSAIVATRSYGSSAVDTDARAGPGQRGAPSSATASPRPPSTGPAKASTTATSTSSPRSTRSTIRRLARAASAASTSGLIDAGVMSGDVRRTSPGLLTRAAQGASGLDALPTGLACRGC